MPEQLLDDDISEIMQLSQTMLAGIQNAGPEKPQQLSALATIVGVIADETGGSGLKDFRAREARQSILIQDAALKSKVAGLEGLLKRATTKSQLETDAEKRNKLRAETSRINTLVPAEVAEKKASTREKTAKAVTSETLLPFKIDESKALTEQRIAAAQASGAAAIASLGLSKVNEEKANQAVLSTAIMDDAFRRFTETDDPDVKREMAARIIGNSNILPKGKPIKRFDALKNHPWVKLTELEAIKVGDDPKVAAAEMQLALAGAVMPEEFPGGGITTDERKVIDMQTIEMQFSLSQKLGVTRQGKGGLISENENGKLVIADSKNKIKYVEGLMQQIDGPTIELLRSQGMWDTYLGEQLQLLGDVTANELEDMLINNEIKPRAFEESSILGDISKVLRGDPGFDTLGPGVPLGSASGFTSQFKDLGGFSTTDSNIQP